MFHSAFKCPRRHTDLLCFFDPYTGKYLARVFNQLSKREELEFAMEEARSNPHSQVDLE